VLNGSAIPQECPAALEVDAWRSDLASPAQSRNTSSGHARIETAAWLEATVVAALADDSTTGFAH
jgi:hypothetical protein